MLSYVCFPAPKKQYVENIKIKIDMIFIYLLIKYYFMCTYRYKQCASCCKASTSLWLYIFFTYLMCIIVFLSVSIRSSCFGVIVYLCSWFLQIVTKEYVDIYPQIYIQVDPLFLFFHHKQIELFLCIYVFAQK